MEIPYFLPVFFDYAVFAYVFPSRYVFVDVELHGQVRSCAVVGIGPVILDIVVARTISIFSFTPVSPIHREFSR